MALLFWCSGPAHKRSIRWNNRKLYLICVSFIKKTNIFLFEKLNKIEHDKLKLFIIVSGLCISLINTFRQSPIFLINDLLSCLSKPGHCASIWQFWGLISVTWELSSHSLTGLALELKLVMLRVHGCQIDQIDPNKTIPGHS